jgi:hypothetical protein
MRCNEIREQNIAHNGEEEEEKKRKEKKGAW